MVPFTPLTPTALRSRAVIHLFRWLVPIPQPTPHCWREDAAGWAVTAGVTRPALFTLWDVDVVHTR